MCGTTRCILVVLKVLLVSGMLLADPDRPVMSDTFQASGEVEYHGTNTTQIGNFVLARDQDDRRGYEKEEYEVGRGMVTEEVLRYDLNKTYYLRGHIDETSCIEEDRNVTGMPSFWAWLKSASYEGTTTIREITYDIWGTNVGGVRFELGKPQSNASILYFYRRKAADSSTFFSFMKYGTTTDSDLFKIPYNCQQGRWKVIKKEHFKKGRRSAAD